MENKGLIGLLAVTAVAVVAAVMVARGGGGPPTDPLVGTRVLPELHVRLDAVARVALVSGGAKTTLRRHAKTWEVEEKGDYPANGVKVRQALLGLAELTFVEPKTEKPALYPRLEVEDADKKGAKSILVTVSDDKGSLLGEIIAGKRKIDELGGGNDGVYVRKPGDAQSWLARGTLDLSGATADWLEKPLIDLPAAKIKDVSLAAPDGTTLAFARAKEGAAFALGEPPPEGKKLKSGALDDPAGALAGLELADVKPAKDFTFPKTGTATARFVTFDGLTLTLTLASEEKQDWAKIEAAGTGAAEKRAAELNAKFAPWVFALPDFKAKLLETKRADVIETPKGS
jgi:Domain of unknown function (DUF4340)